MLGDKRNALSWSGSETKLYYQLRNFPLNSLCQKVAANSFRLYFSLQGLLQESQVYLPSIMKTNFEEQNAASAESFKRADKWVVTNSFVGNELVTLPYVRQSVKEKNCRCYYKILLGCRIVKTYRVSWSVNS